MNRTELIEQINLVKENKIKETCNEMTSLFEDYKKVLLGNVVKFKKSQGVYFIVDNVEMFFDNSLLLKGTKILGHTLYDNELFVLPLKELKDEFFDILSYDEFPAEYEEFLSIMVGHIKNHQAEELAKEMEAASKMETLLEEMSKYVTENGEYDFREIENKEKVAEYIKALNEISPDVVVK